MIKKINNKIVVVIVLVIFVLILIPKTIEEIEVESIQGTWDISQQVAENNLEQYLIEEEDFDYSHPLIFNLAIEIKQRSSSVEEAIKETAITVVNSISYSSSVSISYCYNEKASDVAETGLGDCVSMSRLATSLLRAQGIPARTVGGCLSFFRRCELLFAAVPFQEAQTTEMVEDDFKKRGFLHEWVEVFDGEKWVILEATAGRIYDTQCNTYLQFSYDSNRFNRCTIQDSDFWQECSVY